MADFALVPKAKTLNGKNKNRNKNIFFKDTSPKKIYVKKDKFRHKKKQ